MERMLDGVTSGINEVDQKAMKLFDRLFAIN